MRVFLCVCMQFLRVIVCGRVFVCRQASGNSSAKKREIFVKGFAIDRLLFLMLSRYIRPNYQSNGRPTYAHES